MILSTVREPFFRAKAPFCTGKTAQLSTIIQCYPHLFPFVHIIEAFCCFRYKTKDMKTTCKKYPDFRKRFTFDAVFCIIKPIMKKTRLFLLLILCMIALCGCTKGPKELTIVAEDVKNVPAGEYTLQYSVTDFETYREAYDLQLTVNVYDENNRSVAVANNRTVKLSAEKTYTVIIRLTGKVKNKDISKYKQYTIETIRSDHTVYFVLKDGNITKTLTSCIVKDGEHIPMDEVPEIPAFYAQQNDREGHVRTIVSSKWVYYDENEVPHDLTQEYLSNITEDLKVYTQYEYNDTVIEYTIDFDTRGGEAYPSQKGTVENVFYRPTTSPVRDGYVFLGWCTDENATSYYNWNKHYVISKDMTLYASWANNNAADATPDSYFIFTEKTDNYGNPYYVLGVDDVARLTGDIVLPSAHNGLPVREMINGTFSNSEITSVYIPSTYTLRIARAFSNCGKLKNAIFEAGNLRDNLDVFAFFNCPLLESVVLPDHVITLDEGCFSGCLLLDNVVLPGTLEIVNEKAFLNCKSLNSVVLPNSVKRVYAEAYSGCDALKEFIVGKNSSLQEISSSALNGTAVTEIVLPARLENKITLDNTAIAIKYFSSETQTE